MRIFLALLLILIAAPALAQERAPDFVTVAFHDVVDRAEDRDADATTTTELIRFFDWLKGNGWTPVSLNDLDAAKRGVKPLPPKAILLTFDDGYQSVYTRVYPLLLAYRYPALVAVVGKWMEGAPGSIVTYGNKKVPRAHFLSWEQIREMTGSGLVELASHSYGLHETVLGNPQGNMQPAGATWAYDPATGRYEDDAAYRRRVRADFDRARAQILRETGQAPRALVWPFGRYTAPATEEAKAAGFAFIFQLIHAPDRLDQLDQIARVYPVATDKFSTIATEIGFPPPRAETIRIACLPLDRLASVQGAEAQDAALGRMIEAVRDLGANTLVLDAAAALPAPDAPLGAVFFTTPLRPLASDILDRVIWQMRTRADVDSIYLRLPFTAMRNAIGDAAVRALYADLVRNSAADGLVLDATPQLARIDADAAAQPSSIRWDLAARRDAVDAAALTGDDALQWKAFQAATAVKSHLKLMLAARAVPQTRWPAPLADILLLPTADTTKIAHWLDPLQSGRVALTLPTTDTAEAMRTAQRQGVTAFALCPADLARDAALAGTFSASTYPLKP